MDRARWLPGHPWMFLNLRHGDSLLWINLEHLPDEILSIGWQFTWHGEFAGFDLGEQVTNVLVIKWQATSQKCEKDNAT